METRPTRPSSVKAFDEAWLRALPRARESDKHDWIALVALVAQRQPDGAAPIVLETTSGSCIRCPAKYEPAFELTLRHLHQKHIPLDGGPCNVSALLVNRALEALKLPGRFVPCPDGSVDCLPRPDEQKEPQRGPDEETQRGPDEETQRGPDEETQRGPDEETQRFQGRPAPAREEACAEHDPEEDDASEDSDASEEGDGVIAAWEASLRETQETTLPAQTEPAIACAGEATGETYVATAEEETQEEGAAPVTAEETQEEAAPPAAAEETQEEGAPSEAADVLQEEGAPSAAEEETQEEGAPPAAEKEEEEAAENEEICVGIATDGGSQADTRAESAARSAPAGPGYPSHRRHRRRRRGRGREEAPHALRGGHPHQAFASDFAAGIAVRAWRPA